MSILALSLSAISALFIVLVVLIEYWERLRERGNQGPPLST